MLLLPAVVIHDDALEIARGLKVQLGLQADGIVIDASALTQFDSSALAVMLACSRDAAAAGKTFAVHGLPTKLGQLAVLYGIAELIPAAA